MKRWNRFLPALLGGLLLLCASSCTVGPCGVSWLWSGETVGETSPNSEILSPGQYAPAEVIYREFLPGAHWPEARTNCVYCLGFGDHNSPVPAEFMTRFAGFTPRVFTGTNGLILGPGIRRDPESDRDVVLVTIDSLSISNETAEARVFFIGPSTVATEKLHLARRGETWRVTKRKEETRSYF